MVEFAVVMGVIAIFILVLVGGLEAIDRWKKHNAIAIDPEQVLAARFASGEINEAEYARRLSVLRLGPPLELPD
jgi:putative membrane protein